MDKSELFYFGKVMKTHGISGGVSIKVECDHQNVYRKVKYMLLENKKGFIPYFIQSIVFKADKAYVDFVDVDTVEKARELMGKEIYLPLELLPKLDEHQFYFHEIKGFMLLDVKTGEVGCVNDIIEYPTQCVLQVFKDRKEILVPAQKELIRKVDRKNKTILVDVPEGLIDMYMGL